MLSDAQYTSQPELDYEQDDREKGEAGIFDIVLMN